LDSLLDLLTLGGELAGNIGARERLTLGIGVEKAERMLARELAAGAGTAVDRRARQCKISGAEIRFLPASLAVAEDQRSICGLIKSDELALQQKPAPVFGGFAIGGRCVNECIVDRDHDSLPPKRFDRESLSC